MTRELKKRAGALTDNLSDTSLVTEAFAATLAKNLKLTTVRQLLYHFPRRYEDRTHFKRIADVRHGEAVVVNGKVINVENVPTRSRLVLTKVAIKDSSGIAFLVFFNQWFLKKQFEKLRGKTIVAYGKSSRSAVGRGLELTEVEWEALADDGEDALSANRIVPIYPGTEGVSQSRLRRLLWNAVQQYAALAEEVLPEGVLVRQELPAIGEALR
ncbi:MAG TPA: hypothetical protein VFW40_09330, partial [Capsulimonadaceae bacterium]|nr:hypothetical protein [Capsulimonadaceae bacterium]